MVVVSDVASVDAHMDYLIHIAVLTCIYAILAVSYEVLVGQTGLLSISTGAVYGLGAYASALASTRLGYGFIPSAALAIFCSSLVAGVCLTPALRLRGDTFAIGTFGFQVILIAVLTNARGVTGGALGVSGIPPPVVMGWTVDTASDFCILCAPLAAVIIVATRRLVLSPFGRVLRSIREAEDVAASYGKRVLPFKILVVLYSAGCAGLAGSLYAHYISYIDPTSFTITESILVLVMVIIGGAGTRWGPVVGAATLVVLPEILRFAGFPSSVAAILRQIIYGVALILMMLFRPQGLLGKYRFGRN